MWWIHDKNNRKAEGFHGYKSGFSLNNIVKCCWQMSSKCQPLFFFFVSFSLFDQRDSYKLEKTRISLHSSCYLWTLCDILNDKNWDKFTSFSLGSRGLRFLGLTSQRFEFSGPVVPEVWLWLRCTHVRLNPA